MHDDSRGGAFENVVSSLASRGQRPPIVQSLASPGVLTGLASQDSAVAAGHLLYGLQPLAKDLAAAADFTGLRQALRSVEATLVHVGDALPDNPAAPYLRRGTGRVGVVSIGIQHGYRPTSDSAFVYRPSKMSHADCRNKG